MLLDLPVTVSLPFRPSNKQTNIPVQPHCTVIIYDIYCIFTEMHPVLHVSMIEFIWVLAVLSRITTTIIKHGANTLQKFSTHSPERVLSSPSCAARSSSSISYIFMSKDCFIHDADVFTLICAIPVLKTAQWTAFPRMHAHPKTPAPLLMQRCEVSQLLQARESWVTLRQTYRSHREAQTYILSERLHQRADVLESASQAKRPPGARLKHTTISQLWKHAETWKWYSFERRDPNLKDNIEFVAVCGWQKQ